MMRSSALSRGAVRAVTSTPSRAVLPQPPISSSPGIPVVRLDLHPQAGVGQPHPVPGRRPVAAGVVAPVQRVVSRQRTPAAPPRPAAAAPRRRAGRAGSRRGPAGRLVLPNGAGSSASAQPHRDGRVDLGQGVVRGDPHVARPGVAQHRGPPRAPRARARSRRRRASTWLCSGRGRRGRPRAPGWSPRETAPRPRSPGTSAGHAGQQRRRRDDRAGPVDHLRQAQRRPRPARRSRRRPARPPRSRRAAPRGPAAAGPGRPRPRAAAALVPWASGARATSGDSGLALSMPGARRRRA